jgi:hypothetical protein
LFQKLGGWQKYYSYPLPGTPKDLHPWQDLNANKYLGYGTTTQLGVISNNTTTVVTPQTLTTSSSTPTFSTTSGSATVTITDSGVVNPTTYDCIYFNTPVAVGGLILSGLYQIQTITGTSSYTITAASNATSTSSSGAVPSFTTTVASATVTVTLAGHGLSVGSSINFPISTSVGGLTVNGTYNVVSVFSSSQFTITVNSVATSATTVSMNSGKAQFVYYITLGPVSSGIGYGLGGYGGTRSSTVTITIASPAVITWTAHGFTVGQQVVFTTTLTLPIGITSGTTYYVSATGLATDTFQISTTLANAQAGTSINTSGTQSGTQTGNAAVNGYGGTGAPNIQTGTTLTSTDWSLDNFGQYLVANPAAGGIYYYNPSAGFTTATLIQQAPIFCNGIFVSMPQQQIVAWGSSTTLANGIGVVQDPLLVSWCDIGDFTTWKASATNQAGTYRIPSGSLIVGALQSAQNGLLWTDLDLWAMSYIGYPLVYSFNKVASNCGLIARHACCQLAGVTYWMSQSNFFALSGNGAQAMPCPVWDAVFQDLDTNNLNLCHAGSNTPYNEVWFFYPSKSGGTGQCDKYVKYNAIEQTWDYGSIDRTRWIDQSVLGTPVASASTGIVYQHELTNNADGSALAPSMQTGYWMLAEGEQLTFVDWILPDFKWGLYGGTQGASIQITIYAVNYPGDTPQVFGPYTVTQASQYVNTRIRARYMAMNISSADLNSFWRIGGVKYRFATDGRR